MSVILDISSTIQPRELWKTSAPYFNGIRIIHGDSLGSDLHGIYYGDEINLLFWKQLNMTMNSGRTYPSIYTLHTGYKYIYYVAYRKFIIYDENSNIVFENNVTSINDLNIDFSVHKSHQFEVHVSLFGDIFRFYKIARWLKKDSGGVDAYTAGKGVNNICAPDRVRPYLPTDSDNPTWNIKYIENIDEGEKIIIDDTLKVKEPETSEGFMLSGINYEGLKINNNFYHTTGDIDKTGTLTVWEHDGKMLTYSILLPLLSVSLFPELLPIINHGEVLNNRPLYEPWLIWGIYGIISSKITTDIDTEDFEVFPFDLSPWWA